MFKGMKNYIQMYGKTDHSGQRKGKNNATIFLILYISFEAYLTRCGACQNMQTCTFIFWTYNLFPRGSVVFGIYNFSLFVGNKTHLNEGSVITAVMKREF